MDTETALLVPEDRIGMSEGELEKLLFSYNVIIADPLYHPICPTTARFVPLPHEILLKQEIIIIENLANLEKLPLEFFFMALPLKIEAGSGSPVRAVGWYNE